MLRGAASLVPVLLALMLGGCDLAGQIFPTPLPTKAPLTTPTETTPDPSLTPSVTLTRPCGGGDMQAVAGWQGAGGSLAGAISLRNASDSECRLEGRPGVHLLDALGGLLPVANLDMEAPSDGYSLLKPGQRAFVRFVWRNWCGEKRGPFSLAIAFPEEGGQLTVPARDPSGALLSDTPRCDDPNSTSVISIGTFERAK